MKKAFLVLPLLIISCCFGIEPVKVSFPGSSFLRTSSEFIINNNQVNAVAGVKAVGNLTNFLITIYLPTGEITGSELSLIKEGFGNIIDHSLIKEGDYYVINPGTNLSDGDEVSLGLTFNLSFGTHLIVIDFLASEANHRIEEAVRINEGLNPLIINQSNWSQLTAKTGKQVAWASLINASNPNQVAVDSMINASLLPGASNFQLTSDSGNQSLITSDLSAYFYDSFEPLENKRYILTLLTPPVIETSQEITVINKTDDSVLISNNITLVNLAGVDYINVSYDLGLNFDKVARVACNDCGWYEFSSSLRVLFNNVEAYSVISAVIDYWDTPPALMINTEGRAFSPNSTIELMINLIPEGIIKGLNLEVEVSAPDRELIFADLLSYDELFFGEVLNASSAVNLINAPKGNYTVKVTAREGLRVIAYAENWFIISEKGSLINLWPFLLVMGCVFIGLIIRLRKSNYSG